MLVLSDLLRNQGISVSPDTVQALDTLARQLLRWNSRRNLTAISDYQSVLEKHLFDSLSLIDIAMSSKRLLDIGSGAGFPSLPLKIACPELEVVSVEAVGKKTDFQRHIVRTLKLSGVSILNDRIENFSADPRYCKKFDLVTARALCSLEDFVRTAEPFLAPSGRLVAMKGPEGEEELALLQGGLQEMGWSIQTHHSILPESGAVRCLVVLSKKD